MKKIVFVFVAIATLIFSEETFAQKYGHINSVELLEIMPERATIETSMKSYTKQLETQLTTMSTEYQSLTTEYQTNEAAWTDLIKQAKIEAITDLDRRIQEFQQSAQQSIAKKEQELAAPLLEKAQNAIKEVANANGYAYIFDTSSGVVLHFPEKDNILPLVKKHLNIQ